MRVIGDKVNTVSMSHTLEASEFNITDGSKLIEMILDNAYKDPITATVREICQNASEVDPNFHIHLPTDLEPWLGVLDNGCGLSREDTIQYASGIGASTKDGDNTKVGGFGIGMKVPFTMCDQYTIISRYGGYKYHFSAYKDEYGKAQFRELTAPMEHPLDDTGLEMRIPVDPNQFTEMRRKTASALMFFDPKPTSNTPIEWPTPEYIEQGPDWKLSKQTSYISYNTGGGGQSRLVMGNLWYPINHREFEGEVQTLLYWGVTIEMPIGSVRLPLSREEIIYTDATKKRIREKCEEICKYLKDNIQKELDKRLNIYEATLYLKDLGSLVRNVLSLDTLKYKGEEVTTTHVLTPPFCRVYWCNSHSWWRKTMSMSNKVISTHYRAMGADPKLLFDVRPKEDLEVLIIGPKTPRIPSRLIQYMNEDETRVKKTAVLFQVNEEEGHTEQLIRDNLEKYFGFIDVPLFNDVVPEYKPVATSKKHKSIAKVLIYDTNNRYFEQGNKSFWREDVSDLNLDNNRGLYVNLRNYEVYKSEFNNPTLKRVREVLIDTGFIPEDTQIYGCPGSYKNKLADHPNFMSVDEAVKMAQETIAETIHLKTIKMKPYLEVSALDSYLNGMLTQGEEVNVRNSYWNTVKKTLDIAKNTVYNSSNYEQWQKEKELLFSFPQVAEVSSVKIYEETFEDNVTAKNFFNKYPLIKYITLKDRYQRSLSSNCKAALKQYIEMCESN